jgi:hypothetical protein
MHIVTPSGEVYNMKEAFVIHSSEIGERENPLSVPARFKVTLDSGPQVVSQLQQWLDEGTAEIVPGYLGSYSVVDKS